MSPGRSAAALRVLAFSVYTWPHPAAASASCCSWASWASVETRASLDQGPVAVREVENGEAAGAVAAGLCS